jgi:hypothetical protein
VQPEEGRHVLQYAARPASPPAPPPRPPTGTTPPPTLCARARAEDTDKCKNFSQLIQKNPEKCSSSKNFAKRCRASCHVEYPEENYCVSTNAGKIVPHVALEYLACTKDDDCDDDQFCSVSCHNDAPGCETQENVCQPCDECHVGDDAVSGKCRDGCAGCPDGGVPPCAPSLDGKIDGNGKPDEKMPVSDSDCMKAAQDAVAPNCPPDSTAMNCMYDQMCPGFAIDYSAFSTVQTCAEYYVALGGLSPVVAACAQAQAEEIMTDLNL